MPVAPVDLTAAIDVRTKFPVARIKRIMQADEDVGKVAQATPTAVGKSLSITLGYEHSALTSIQPKHLSSS
jgi:predicted transcriptional regulator